MINFINFIEEDVLTIIDALWFTRDTILDQYKKIAAKTDSKIQEPIWEEYRKIVKPILDAKDFFEKNINSSYIPLRDEFFFSLMDIVSSSLTFYGKNLEMAQENTGVDAYGDLIGKVNKILSSEALAKAKTDLFQKFYLTNAESIEERTRKTKFFISYQIEDREIAGEIKKLLVGNSDLAEEDVFVAHRDIALSKKWRDDILSHLEICTHLIALCTENYRYSAWGNQELGYVMAKKDVRIIPLFWEGVTRENFGFIEGFQALPYYINEKNLDEAVNEILKKVGIKK